MTLDALLTFFCELVQKIEAARNDVQKRRLMAERQEKLKKERERKLSGSAPKTVADSVASPNSSQKSLDQALTDICTGNIQQTPGSKMASKPRRVQKFSSKFKPGELNRER